MSWECIICQEASLSIPQRVLKCNHILHDKCISEWYRHSRTCPLCRDTTQLVQPTQRILLTPLQWRERLRLSQHDRRMSYFEMPYAPYAGEDPRIYFGNGYVPRITENFYIHTEEPQPTVPTILAEISLRGADTSAGHE